jgi:hypothetical protein
MNAQGEFDIGKDEEPRTVSLSEDGSSGEVVEKEPSVTVETLPDDKKEHRQELEEYGKNVVQKRIDKLVSRLHEAERRETAALDFAKNVQAQKEDLEKRFQATDFARLNETKSRIDSQILGLKQVIRKAREEGDLDTETEAQQRLATLAVDQSRVLEASSRRPAMQQEQPVAQQPVYQAPQAAPQQLDPRAEEWAEKNTWFGRDVVMTGAVRGIHIELVKNQGFDPASDEYYDEIDRRMQNMFPDRFKQPAAHQTISRSSRPVQTVASANRATGAAPARRLVKLTPSQVAIAKKLNVPLEEYAKYVKE